MRGFTIIISVPLPLTASAAELTGQISRIVDGDTFDLAGETIRLCGIDAPEHGDHGCAEAIVALTEITADRNVRCVQVGGGTVCDGRLRRIMPHHNLRHVRAPFSKADLGRTQRFIDSLRKADVPE